MDSRVLVVYLLLGFVIMGVEILLSEKVREGLQELRAVGISPLIIVTAGVLLWLPLIVVVVLARVARKEL